MAEEKVEGQEETKKTKKELKAEKAAAKAAAKAAKDSGEAAPAVEGEEGAEGATPKKSKKKLIIIAALVVVLLGGGAAGVILSGALKGSEEHKEVDPSLVQKTIYFDMDEFLVNLNNPGNQVSFLKTVITLEVPNQAVMTEITDGMPKIRDTFQVYLREMRNSDLQGSAGLQRLRAELLLRVNSILEKGKVTNILFKEIIVQ